MPTIKVKFRPSIVDGKEGSIYYQITHNRVVRQLSTGYKVFPEELDTKKNRLEARDQYRQKHIDIIASLVERDIRRFKLIIKKFDELKIKYSADDIVVTFIDYINKYSFKNFTLGIIGQFRQMNKLRAVETYSTTLKSFMNFREDNDMIFEEITSDTMIMYEAYLHNNGLSKNTSSFYLRILRAVYNRAVEKGITIQRYPFKHVYTGIDRTTKRAITLDDIRQIKMLDLSEMPMIELSRDIFLFSFYTRGMSFVDIAFLRKDDLKDGILSYRRKKTGQILAIKWEECMQKILDRHRTNSNNPFLLPILRDPTEDCRRQYKSALFRTNRHLKRIASMAGLTSGITLYTARHSWASAAKNKNIPISVISEGMGHDSEKKTKIYLASLDTAIIDKANTLILGDLENISRDS